jgi:hypothetical protein
MEATHRSKEVVSLQRLCSGIGFEQRAMKVSCNSQSTIFLAKNPVYHLKTKNIDVQYHFVRDMVESNKVLLEKVDMLENIADSLAKSVSVVKFSWCREIMGYCFHGSVNKSSRISCFNKEDNKWENVRLLYSL